MEHRPCYILVSVLVSFSARITCERDIGGYESLLGYIAFPFAVAPMLGAFTKGAADTAGWTRMLPRVGAWVALDPDL